VSTATPTATSAATSSATEAGHPSRAAVRWYQLALLVLGVALAAVTALAVYLAVNNSTASPSPTSGTVTEQTCWQPQVAC
jgi:hypothetical protein